LKAFRTALIWVLIFIVVGGSLYFLDNIIPRMSSLLVSTRDIVQSPPFILKFDSSSEKFINIFSELPLILPQYNNGFLIKYNNLADVYIFSSDESLTNYIEDLSKINVNGSVKITKSWLNGFQVFSTKIGFTYYITRWRDYIIISNDPDYLKDLFDNIILAARSSEGALPESIFEPGNKNFGFVQPSGENIFANLYSIPFIQISYPMTYFLSLNSIKISFKTNETVETETTGVNKLQVFDFSEPVFEIASNNPEKFNTLLKNNFIAYFLEKYNIAIDKILKTEPGLSEFVLLKDETYGFILQTQNPDEVIDNIDTDVTSTNINDSSQLVNKL
jgi:hypothetical protein